MGKQSARLYYQGKDHKDIFFQNKYHHKMYKGGDLVWEKLYRYFVRNNNLEVFDFDSKKYLSGNDFRYSIFRLKKGPTDAIAIMYDTENERYFFAISYDMLRWKEVKEIEYKARIDGKSVYYFFMASYNGFFVYEQAAGNKNNTLYFLEIDYGLEYTVKKIYSSNILLLSPSQYGISNYFYGIQFDKAYTYILHRIGKDGKITSGQLKGNFIKDNVDMFEGGGAILADEIGNAYIISFNVGASNGGTYISKVENMDTETIYTAFWARASKTLNGSYCDIDILYDSYQTLFLAHRGFTEEKEFVEGGRGKNGYYNMDFYKIDSIGRTMSVSQKKDWEIKVRCFGVSGRTYLTIVFGGKKDSSYKGPEEEGIIYFYDVRKGISSSTADIDLDSVIFDYDKTQEDAVFVGEFYYGKYYVIFIDNLFFNESEGNFIAAIDWE